MIKTKSKLKNIYNCPSLRTSALKLANEFKNHNENNNLEVKINGIGATYPIMNWQRLRIGCDKLSKITIHLTKFKKIHNYMIARINS